MLSSALRTQWDAQQAANQHQEDKVSAHSAPHRSADTATALSSTLQLTAGCVRVLLSQLSSVLSRVDSVLDRTTRALASGQSTLQAADAAIAQAQQKAVTKREQLRNKRKPQQPTEAKRDEGSTSATDAKPEEQDAPQADEPSRTAPRPSRRAARKDREQPVDSNDEQKEETPQQSGPDKENVRAVTNAPTAPTAASAVSAAGLQEKQATLPSSIPTVDPAAVIKKRKLTSVPTSTAQSSSITTEPRAALQPIAGPRSFAPSRNLFMSFLQGANAMRAPKLKT